MSSWGGRRAATLTRLVLQRDHDPDAGYTPCRWCGRPATTADHWPVARVDGGPDDLANLVPACRPCNSSRGGILGNHRRHAPRPSRRW